MTGYQTAIDHQYRPVFSFIEPISAHAAQNHATVIRRDLRIVSVKRGQDLAEHQIRNQPAWDRERKSQYRRYLLALQRGEKMRAVR